MRISGAIWEEINWVWFSDSMLCLVSEIEFILTECSLKTECK